MSDILAGRAGRRRRRVCRGCCSCHTAPPHSPPPSHGNQQHSRCQEGTERPLGCHWATEEKDGDEGDGEEIKPKAVAAQSANTDEKKNNFTLCAKSLFCESHVII